MPIRLAPAVQNLVNELQKLPGFGPRSAQRAAFHLLEDRQEQIDRLRDALVRASREVSHCRCCHTLTDDPEGVCPLCRDPDRDRTLLCIVESVGDQMALDASLAWPGVYFVLSGRLSPVQGIGPSDIGLPALFDRIQAASDSKAESLREIVVATSYTPEGDATAYYIIDCLKKRWPGLHVTRLARGLPSGIEIEYTDLNTIANAVYSRR